MVATLFAQEAAAAAHAANIVTRNAWVIPAIPAICVFLIWAVGKRLPRGGAEIGVGGLLAACTLSYIVLANFIGGNGPLVVKQLTWFPFGLGTTLGVGIRVDGLTAIMFCVVTTISLMVQIYSIGYMHGEKRFTWYYTALNIFTASMLLLVVSNNLLQLLVGWELVGICSYLLIGFWWEEKANSDAAIKAFITTKTGDVPFLIGIFVIYASAHTFDIGQIIAKAEAHQISTLALTAGAILLFGGAIGKSAQFPLHVWLPDAMAGPTPVSALIHAATMVTAGVFLVARLFPVFEGSTAAMNVVAIIGAFTMLMAALLAMVQDDIKRVLAYSTISQLAYMMAALGVGAGNAGIFHLFTHAWFKALLFLGAGSVIHSVHSNNMSEMGGLKKVMPTTYWTFVVATLALAGIFPFAGFWSKDEILTEAFRVGHGTTAAHGTPVVGFIVYGAGLLTAFVTAFYMSRAVHLTFEGEYRGTGHPHESPRAMTFPLQVLGVLSVVAGFVGFPAWKHGFANWIGVGGEAKVSSANFALIGISLLVAIGGLYLGRVMYMPAPATEPLERLGWFHTLLVNKYYMDDFYMKGIIYPIRDSVSAAMYWLNQNVFDGAVNGTAAVARATAKQVYETIDQKVIDGTVNAVGMGTQDGSRLLRYIQSGDIQRYAALLFAGVAILVLLFTLVFR
ncbi:MAG: NADH-quinone oxidoreductase subunit L [Actinomycetota bacterium]